MGPACWERQACGIGASACNCQCCRWRLRGPRRRGLRGPRRPRWRRLRRTRRAPPCMHAQRRKGLPAARRWHRQYLGVGEWSVAEDLFSPLACSRHGLLYLGAASESQPPNSYQNLLSTC